MSVLRTLLELAAGLAGLVGAAWALARLRAIRSVASLDLRSTRIILAATALAGFAVGLHVLLKRTPLPVAPRQWGVTALLFTAIGLLCWADEVEYPGTARALAVVGLGLAACVAGLALLPGLPLQYTSAHAWAAGALIAAGFGLFYVALRMSRRLRSRPPF